MMLVATLQSTWLESLHILGGRPDLAILITITWAIIRGADEGAMWGFVGGIFCDLLSGGTFGLWTIALTATGFLSGQPWVYALGPTVIRLALMSALGTLFGHLILLIMMAFMGYTINIVQAIQTTAGPAALLNLLLSPFTFRFLVWFHQHSSQPAGGAG